jgi:hypothetical protein
VKTFDSRNTHIKLQRTELIRKQCTNFIVEQKSGRLRLFIFTCFMSRFSRSLAHTSVPKSIYVFLHGVNHSARTYVGLQDK